MYVSLSYVSFIHGLSFFELAVGPAAAGRASWKQGVPSETKDGTHQHRGDSAANVDPAALIQGFVMQPVRHSWAVFLLDFLMPF